MDQRTPSLARAGQGSPEPAVTGKVTRRGRRPVVAQVEEQFPACFDGRRFRGRAYVELEPFVIEKLGCGFAVAMAAKRAIVAHDGTATGVHLNRALIAGLLAQGVNVEDMGSATLDELRFGIARRRACGGVYVAADDLGGQSYEIRCLGRDTQPLDPRTDLTAIARLAQRDAFMPAVNLGIRIDAAETVRESFVEALIGAMRIRRGPACRIVMNRDIRPVASLFQLLQHDELLRAAGIEFAARPGLNQLPAAKWSVQNEALREQIADIVVDSGAHLGVFWLSGLTTPLIADEQGQIVDHGDLMILLAKRHLAELSREPIVYDPRVAWQLGRLPENGTPGAFPSDADDDDVRLIMRSRRASFGFQLPDRYYYGSLDAIESGVMAVLSIAELCGPQQPLSQLISSSKAATSPLQTRRIMVKDSAEARERLRQAFAGKGAVISKPSSLTIVGEHWRAMVRTAPGAGGLEIALSTIDADAADVLQQLCEAMGASAVEVGDFNSP